VGAEIPGAVNTIAFGVIGMVAVTLRCTPACRFKGSIQPRGAVCDDAPREGISSGGQLIALI
jgi:hypothetical protein